MTTLSNSFCVIHNEKDLNLFSKFRLTKPINYTFPLALLSNVKKHWIVPDNSETIYKNFISHLRTSSKEEISKYYFLDLLHDRIIYWRLEELGFERKLDAWNMPYYQLKNILINHNYRVYFMDEPMNGIKSFSNLLTLIKLIYE